MRNACRHVDKTGVDFVLVAVFSEGEVRPVGILDAFDEQDSYDTQHDSRTGQRYPNQNPQFHSPGVRQPPSVLCGKSNGDYFTESARARFVCGLHKACSHIMAQSDLFICSRKSSACHVVVNTCTHCGPIFIHELKSIGKRTSEYGVQARFMISFKAKVGKYQIRLLRWYSDLSAKFCRTKVRSCLMSVKESMNDKLVKTRLSSNQQH